LVDRFLSVLGRVGLLLMDISMINFPLCLCHHVSVPWPHLQNSPLLHLYFPLLRLAAFLAAFAAAFGQPRHWPSPGRELDVGSSETNCFMSLSFLEPPRWGVNLRHKGASTVLFVDGDGWAGVSAQGRSHGMAPSLEK